MKKQHLPEKICPVCNRPFQWRKKWERCWEEVVYCSDRCRRNKTKEVTAGAQKPSRPKDS
jgi:hypothetical protein